MAGRWPAFVGLEPVGGDCREEARALADAGHRAHCPPCLPGACPPGRYACCAWRRWSNLWLARLGARQDEPARPRRPRLRPLAGPPAPSALLSAGGSSPTARLAAQRRGRAPSVSSSAPAVGRGWVLEASAWAGPLGLLRVRRGQRPSTLSVRRVLVAGSRNIPPALGWVVTERRAGGAARSSPPTLPARRSSRPANSSSSGGQGDVGQRGPSREVDNGLWRTGSAF